MPRKVVVQAHTPVEKLDFRIEPAIAKIQSAPSPDGPQQFIFSISPLPSLPPGPFKGEIVVDVIGPDGERVPGAALPFAGNIQPQVRPLPARLLLGAKRVGEKAEATVVLQAPAEAAWNLEHIETDSFEVRVEAIKGDKALAGRAFRVIQQIKEEGDHTSQVRFVIRRPGQEPLVLTTEIHYHGEPRANASDAEKKK